MPSTYSARARYTLQAPGENLNLWGVILNQGVFALVDEARAKRVIPLLRNLYDGRIDLAPLRG